VNRGIDDAMAADRPAKAKVRTTWINLVESVAERGSEPVYLTMCGKAGPEIDSLIERGVISVTESGAIDADDAYLVVAVENSPGAIASLQARFPGLKILDRRIQDVMRSSNPVKWPEGDDRRCCRARVVNLDFDSSLKGNDATGTVRFDDLDVVAKFATIHALDVAVPEWDLFITFNATLGWSPAIANAVASFLRENFSLEPEFRDRCVGVMGASLVDAIEGDADIDVANLSSTEQQALLMAFVPKKVAHLVHNTGWSVSTEFNWRYGGEADAAPMVTFGLRFRQDSRSASAPLELYREAVRGVLVNAGSISESGDVVAL
jgi:hypothetical protein